MLKLTPPLRNKARAEVRKRTKIGSLPGPSFDQWLPIVTPTWDWQWAHLRLIRQHLDRITWGELRRLMLFVPPRHGKTEQGTVRYPVYRLERDPSLRVIIWAYNQILANKFSRKARRIAVQRIPMSRDRVAVEDWETAAGGGIRAVGVGSGITGQGSDLILIDDPVKSREEAESQAYRDRVWESYTDDLYTRQEPGCAIVLTMTRWHEDDLAGRILASEDGPNWEVVRLPAIAEDQSERDDWAEKTGQAIGLPDPLGRQPGEPLCPERYDLETLEATRLVLRNGFEALYQQRPNPPKGEFFQRGWFPIVDAMPTRITRVRYWDKAGTEGGSGAFSAGVLMAKSPDNDFFVEDVVRGRWSAGTREATIKQTADMDGKEVVVWVEQEPGSGGKESAQSTIRNLAGFDVHAEAVTGDKVSRARPLAAQAEAGNVKLLRDRPGRRWNEEFIDELSGFPHGKFKDQVDAASGAFNKLVAPPKILPATYGPSPVRGYRGAVAGRRG